MAVRGHSFSRTPGIGDRLGGMKDQWRSDLTGDGNTPEHRFTETAWEFTGVGVDPTLHKEPLEFEYAHPSTRSYK